MKNILNRNWFGRLGCYFSGCFFRMVHWFDLLGWSGVLSKSTTPAVGRMRASIICTCRSGIAWLLTRMGDMLLTAVHISERSGATLLVVTIFLALVALWNGGPGLLGSTLMSICFSLVKLKIYCIGVYKLTSLELTAYKS